MIVAEMFRMARESAMGEAVRESLAPAPFIRQHEDQYGICFEVINRKGDVEMRTWDEGMAQAYLEMLRRRYL